jgi:peptidoglycan/LPS O-acetylase OafA/YrhL
MHDRLSPKNTNPLYVLQACRALACLMVVVYHGVILVGNWYGMQPFSAIYNFGYAGVHLFFVISGFIIYHAHYQDINNTANIYQYFVKRIVRIYPLYWLVFFVWGGWRVFIGRFDALDFIGNALFFSSEKKLIVPVSWTLAHEILFYGLFVCFIASRKIGYLIFSAWFALVIGNYFYDATTALPLRLANLLFVFGLAASGVFKWLASYLNQGGREFFAWGSAVLGFAVFTATTVYCSELSGGGVEIIDVWGNLWVTAGFGLGSAFILLSSVSVKLENYLQGQKFILLLGNASYSIYLVHFYIQRMAFNLTKSAAALWQAKSEIIADGLLCFVAIASIAAGILIHLIIEKPILAKLRFKLRKKPA